MSSFSTSDIIIIAVIAFAIYFFFIKSDTTKADPTKASSSAKDAATLDKDADLPAFNTVELRKYDGKQDKKVYIAVGAKVFDCTGDAQYAPGGALEHYAGRDISRAVAKFGKEHLVHEHLDNGQIHDLNMVEKDKLKHVFNQFYTKHTIVGKYVRELKKEQ